LSALSVTIPKTFAPEIEYVLHVFFKQHYGIFDYDILYADEDFYSIKKQNGEIKIRNLFFKGKLEDLYKVEHLPKENKTNRLKIGQDIYEINALYGEASLSKNETSYQLDADIFASAFLLLTQWEYNVTANKDHLGRVKLGGSTLDKFSLYHIPIVNQYIELLSKLLESIGQKIERVQSKVTFTCDVDSITKYKTLRNLFGAIYHMNFKEYLTAFGQYFNSKRNKINDPYYSAFDFIVEKLSKKNLSGVFYFMAGVTDIKYDTKDYDLNDPLIQYLVAKIRDRGHSIGIHPSINSWEDSNILGEEISILSDAFNQKVVFSRQHFLRYNPYETWGLLESCGIKSDSSVQFTEGIGFAVGMCTPYQLFDLKNRKILNVIEEPLLVMIKKDYAINYNKQLDKIRTVIAEAKKYNGRFMILFHNSNLETKQEKRFFEEVIDLL
jgi:hypothetical protein